MAKLTESIKDIANRLVVIGEGYKKEVSLFKSWVLSDNNEDYVIQALRVMANCGDLESSLNIAKVDSYRFEVSVDGGRIDMLLRHFDKGLTIVEAKGDISRTGIASGIGQLAMYEVALLDQMSDCRPLYINKILIAPTLDDVYKSLSIYKACHSCGVKYVAIHSHKTSMLFAEKLLRKRIA